MLKKHLSKIIALLLMFTMIAGIMLPAMSIDVSANDELDDKKGQVENLDAQLDALEDQLAAIDSNQQSQQATKDNAEQQIDILTEKITLQIEIVMIKQQEIVVKQEEIDTKKQDIADTDEILKERLRSMYMTRTSGSLSILLAANTMSEFLTSADAMQRVAMTDTQLLEQLDSDMKALQQQEEALNSQLLDLEEEQRLLEESKTAYAGALQQADAALDSLEAQEAATELEHAKIYAEYEAAKAEYERAIAEATANSTMPYVGGEYLWPVPGRYFISSPFGWRTLYGMSDYHIGIDIATNWGAGEASIAGAPIAAANDGVVTKTVYGNTGYGIYAMIDHGGGNLTLYGHCNGLAVSQGQAVSRGDTIGYVGTTGNSTGYHLHFEIRQGGTAVNPEPLLRSS